MKRLRFFLVTFILVACVSVFLLSGCETVKGMGRDIKNADEWMREHLW